MPIDKIKAGVNKMIKPKNLGHYWKLKMDWELMSREIKKKADELDNAEHIWETTKVFRSLPMVQQRGYLDLSRLKSKVAKLQAVLEAFENSLPKESLPKNRYRKISGQHLPIEIEGGEADDK